MNWRDLLRQRAQPQQPDPLQQRENPYVTLDDATLRRMTEQLRAYNPTLEQENRSLRAELAARGHDVMRLLARVEALQHALERAASRRSTQIGVSKADLLALIKLAHPDKNPDAVGLATKITAALNALRDRLG